MRSVCVAVVVVMMSWGCDDSGTVAEDDALQDTVLAQDTGEDIVDGSDGPDVEPVVCTENPPVAESSSQDVTFTLSNPGTEPVWVPTAGFYCDTWEITGVTRNLGWDCGCECPNPGTPHVMELEQVAPGETLEITWDARQLARYTEPLDCSDWGGGTSCVPSGVRQPAEAGDYTFVVGALSSLPSDCTDNGDGTAGCISQGGGFDELPGSVQRLCDVATTVEANFSLPASGALAVDVDLTATAP